MKRTNFRARLAPVLALVLIFALALSGCGADDLLVLSDGAAAAVSTEAPNASYYGTPHGTQTARSESARNDAPDEDAWLYQKDDVARYLEAYGVLPQNYITKSEARDLGWVAEEGNLWDVADGMCIGGDVFGNREGLLPEKAGRVYYECDVDYDGGFRSSHRLVFSNDGLIYYTEDHYEHFTLLLEP